uniref:Uncharacterized protein n=1 Tax=Oryza rufipogon TaxID=4529 RepID=A0A0E0QXX2_ORYRU
MAMVRLSMSVWPVAPRSAAEGGLGGARADVECSATPLGWACSRSSRSRTPQGLSATTDAITREAADDVGDNVGYGIQGPKVEVAVEDGG